MTESGRIYLDNLKAFIRISDARFHTMEVRLNRVVLMIDVGHVPVDVIRGIDELERKARLK